MALLRGIGLDSNDPYVRELQQNLEHKDDDFVMTMAELASWWAGKVADPGALPRC